jgi:hypothetical protein
MSFYASSRGHLMANLALGTPAAARFRARGLFRARQEAAGAVDAPWCENRAPFAENIRLPSVERERAGSFLFGRAKAQ